MRIRLDIEYEGTAYSGWQRQKNARSIQQLLEEALEKITGAKTTVHGSGRTDAGVHAMRQTAHFDTDSALPPERFAYALNYYLPPDIRVLSSRSVPDDFHARYSASGKTYRYTFRNDQQQSALYRHFTAHVREPLDLDRMRAAARHLVGTHDFASFTAHSGPDKNTVRTIEHIDIQRSGPYVTIEITGNGFLHNMVRIIAGTLAEVGKGAMAPEQVPLILYALDRAQAGPTAPAAGLILIEARYGHTHRQAGGHEPSDT